MRTLVKKMTKPGLIKLRMVVGALFMAVAMIIVPVGIIYLDITLLANPYVLGVVIIAMLMFAAVGFFGYIYPYKTYLKMPEVLAETDGEFLYIHTKNEAKIPVAALADSIMYVDLPFIYQKEFLSDFIIHIFSEEYGTVTLDVPDYGTYKMRFVSQATKTGDNLIRFIREANNIV